MIIHVLSQEANGDLLCDSPEGRIWVDPFVTCAVETDDCIAAGRDMIGRRYHMGDYFLSGGSKTYLCNRWTPLTGPPANEAHDAARKEDR